MENEEFIEILKKTMKKARRNKFRKFKHYLIEYYYEFVPIERDITKDFSDFCDLTKQIDNKEISKEEKYKETALLINPTVKSAFIYIYEKTMKKKRLK